jgi:MIP family channel proteins
VRDARPEAAEAVGTFFLMLIGGAAILAGQPGWLVALAFGGVVAVLVYALGHVSGAHFNPAVTLAFAATGHFPWRRVPAYVLAQLAGALLACVVLLGLGDLGPAVASGRLHGFPAFATETLATALLAFTIIAVATDRRAAPGVAGLAIGLAVSLGALVAGPLTGAAMNPARALAPAVLSGRLDGLLLHVAGPLAGGLTGMLGYEALRRGRKPEAERVLGAAGPFPLEGKDP